MRLVEVSCAIFHMGMLIMTIDMWFEIELMKLNYLNSYPICATNQKIRS